ncbi:ABC transporter permease [Halobium palmae]|uniref:ABC transporter permease n=1 Tax=Halobium palmae TaxID=1776492 RepID=A0ABD5RV58_9EURY
MRAVIGIGVAQLRHDKARTVFAVIGITLAVLATTLLAGAGIGVVETGEQMFSDSGRDLWVTGGAVRLAPGSVGGFENPVQDAHQVSAEITARDDVATAVPMSFQTVYVSDEGEEFTTIVGTGGPARGGSVTITEGDHFSRQSPHYANGTYEGPMLHEVVIDKQTAESIDVSVGDTLYIGGTISSARQHEFTIVGISPTFSKFLGTQTVVLPLSEMQEVTGTTESDTATMISVSLTDDAKTTAPQVERELQNQYPQYEIRTNREQLQKTLRDQAVVLASGGSLVVLAVVSGAALTVNLLISVVYHQRQELAALKALGSSTTTLVSVVFVQAIGLGILGGLLGLLLTYPAVTGLNTIAAALVGFENVVQMPRWILLGGFGMALAMSLLGGLAAGTHISQLSPLDGLAE